MKPLKKAVSITLDYPVLEKIQKLAEYEDRSLSSYINLVLREHLEKKRSEGRVAKYPSEKIRREAGP